MDTKRKYITKKRFWAGTLLAQFLLFFIASKIGPVLEFFVQFFDFQKRIHQNFFAAVPYSVGDAVYTLLAIVLIILLLRIVNKNTRNSYLLKSLVLLNILYFTYQIFWGILYFQEPIIEKLPVGEITLEETKALTIKYLELSRQARLSVEEDDKGVFKLRDITHVKTEILSRQERLPAFLEPTKPSNINSFKPSLFRGVMSYSGILGYYNPFTA
ncbi:MAG: DUF3810 family protein, partial [Chryseobacterium sp.]|nr:DUF3810 family protein [Chryseobacterium sp.]